MVTFCTPGPELVTDRGATADSSAHSRGTPPGGGSRHLGQEKTLGHLKEHSLVNFMMYTIGVSPASAVLLEGLLSWTKSCPWEYCCWVPMQIVATDLVGSLIEREIGTSTY